jgi:hypothetical protein
MAAAGGSNTFAGGLANAPYYIVVTDGAENVISPATAANQTNGTQTTRITDGTNTVALGNIGTGKVSLNVGQVFAGGNVWTAVNPSGSTWAGQIDVASVGGTALLATALNTDGISGAQFGVPVAAFLFGYNGATEDRIKATNGAINAVFSSQYPAGAVPVVAAGTGTTGAVTATLPGTSGKTTYVCGFTIMAAATSLATGTATVAGLVGGVTFTYDQTVAAAANGTSKLTETFTPGIPASATNTGIVVTSAAAGLGGVTDVNVWGYQL